MEIKTDELMSLNITIPEIYILTRVINRISNKFYPKDLETDIPIIEPQDIVNSFRMIPCIRTDRISEEIKYTFVKNLRDLENLENNDFYDRKLRDNINRIFDTINFESKETKTNVLKTILEEIKPYKLHYPHCSIYLLPYTLMMIREWISYINIKGNKQKYEFADISRKTILACIFQNKKCYKCDTGKLSNFILCSKDLSCENLKCNYKYKVYLHKKENDKVEDDKTKNNKEKQNNKYCFLVIKNSNIEVIDCV
jgi:hypothetical protein